MAPHPHLVYVFTATLLSLTCTSLFPVNAAPRSVTLHNDRPRLDVAGQVVDAHDGMLLAHAFPNASTIYFLYGEFYNLTSGGAQRVELGEHLILADKSVKQRHTS
jgi:hypothetical protein